MTALRCPHCGSHKAALLDTTIEPIDGGPLRVDKAYWCLDCWGIVIPPRSL